MRRGDHGGRTAGYEAELTHKQTHSQRVMPMVDAALQMSDMTLEDMDVLGAVVGPGSFTGVRIGVSTVKALGACGGQALRRGGCAGSAGRKRDRI